MDYMQNIKALRKEYKKTQKDMAVLLKTTQQQYCKYENGFQEMPIRHIITISLYFNISADYILGLPKGMPYGHCKTK